MTNVLDRPIDSSILSQVTSTGSMNERLLHSARHLELFSPVVFTMGTNTLGSPSDELLAGRFQVSSGEQATSSWGASLGTSGLLQRVLSRIDQLMTISLDEDYSSPSPGARARVSEALSQLAWIAALDYAAFEQLLRSLHVGVNGAGEFQLEFWLAEDRHVELLVGREGPIWLLGSCGSIDVDASFSSAADAALVGAGLLRADFGERRR